MRYIGNKETLLDKIYYILQSKNVCGNSFFDFFSGTTNVARYFKKHNYKVFSSDILYLSYCLQKAYIENNEEPSFNTLLSHIDNYSNYLFSTPLEIVVNHLNSIKEVEGFIYKNYTPQGTSDLLQPRMYFNNDNGKKIDAIRLQIEIWKNKNYISENEYYILLSCLIETVPFYANISGVYAAFYKKWDPRAIKPLKLKPIEIIINHHKNAVYYGDSLSLCSNIDVDILYLDPPYNERQYAPNYHLLETIASYDNPIIRGVTGMRNYEKQKSTFCNPISALHDLDFVAKTAKYKFLILSYNSEGIMKKDDIISTLSQYGKVEQIEFEYLRYKSNSNGQSSNKKHIFEQLYILKK